MRAFAELVSTVADDLRADLDRRGRATTAGLRRAARGFEGELEQVSARAGLGRLAKGWASRTYPERGGSLASAAVIYVRGGERTQKAVKAFSEGALVEAKGGRWLAIPTNFNRVLGRRRTGRERANVKGEVRVTPEEMARSGLAFLVPRRGGGFHWMLRVTVAESRNRRGVKRLAYAGGLVPVGTSSRKMAEGLLKARAVPMYTLLPPFAVTPRFAVGPIEARWRGRVPGYVNEEYRRLSHG